MIELLKWFLLLTMIGWITFPICFFFFKNLKTRAFGLSKIFAMLLWGYLFWGGNIFSIMSNSGQAALFILVLITCISIYIMREPDSRRELFTWIRNQWRLIVFSESVFLAFSLFMLVLRGASPQILGTEKPMELMFINAIDRSISFPPADAWLSGYAISYYYFGYVIINVIVKLLGTDTGIAFNLSLIFWFGLIAGGAADLLINLIESRDNVENIDEGEALRWEALWIGLLAPTLILIISNGEGLLELLHSLGLFWKADNAGTLFSSFWTWLDIRELVDPPNFPLDWDIQRAGGTWWWRASRVLQDYAVDGSPREVIDEFPFFSFFLGDLHPHLLTIPFVILSISLSLNTLSEKWHANGIYGNLFISTIKNGRIWLQAFIIGALIFLNTWDFPIYFGLFALVILYKVISLTDNFKTALYHAAVYLILLGVIALLAYAPFLIGFSSQAGGVLPSLVFQSRSVHLAVIFLPLLVPVVLYLTFIIIPRLQIRKFLMVTMAVFGIYVLGLVLSFGFVMLTSPANLRGLLSIYGAESTQQLLIETINRIINDPLDILFLIVIISAGISIATNGLGKGRDDLAQKFERSEIFYGILLVIASTLIIFPELFYLRDQFGWRMNTIFKFYFQAWVLFALCAGYSLYQIFKCTGKITKTITALVVFLGFAAGSVYPVYAFKERLHAISVNGVELDGNKYVDISNPGEAEAIAFFDSRECGIIAEAIGGSYSNYGRVSRLTGCPTVLGWPGHEIQWRGSGDALGSRESDIETLYRTTDWLTAATILDTYEIQYVFIGTLERSTYKVDEEKFENNLVNVFENDSVIIYGVQ